jgi:hypothetical protein
MRWLAPLREALDEAHKDHEDGCGCYDALTSAMDGKGYRFPGRLHYVEEPPQVGCQTPYAALIERVVEERARQMYAGMTGMNSVIRGLDATVPKP